MKEKVVTYIDGFNLYYALKDKGWQRYYWLNVQKLSRQLLKPNQTLVETKYFTARVKSNPSKKKRQNAFISALKTIPNLKILEGVYRRRERLCNKCNQLYWTYEEKMTDVNIAIALLEDAFSNRYDTALLISADSDLVEPIKTVRRIFPHKRIIVAFPPGRSSFDLQATASGYITIWEMALKNSLFPATITTSRGRSLKKPPSWS